MSFALLYTDEIRLRALEPSDVDVLMRLENDEELWKNGIVTGPFSRFQLERYIAENTNDIYVDGQLRLVIEHCSGSVAGVIDLCTFDARHSRAEVGIVVLKEFRRRGIARSALSLLERHCFSLLGMHQLYAYVKTSNAACINLFHSAGFNTTGVLKDWLHTGRGYQDVCLLQKMNPLIA